VKLDVVSLGGINSYMECKQLILAVKDRIISEEIEKLKNGIPFIEFKSQMIVERRKYHG